MAARPSAANICQGSPRENGSAALASPNQMLDPTRKPCAPRRSVPRMDTGSPALKPGLPIVRSPTCSWSGQNRARIKTRSADFFSNVECTASRRQRFRKSFRCGSRRPAGSSWTPSRSRQTTFCRTPRASRALLAASITRATASAGARWGRPRPVSRRRGPIRSNASSSAGRLPPIN
jgi:hypothetical protein